jgi:hypothetical protein
MEKTRALAMFTVGRAVFFGSLAVSLIMLTFLFDMVLFFRSGAIMAFAMSTILLWYTQTATQRPPKRTETWLLLEDNLRPRNQHAVNAFTVLMQEVYAYYARHVFLVGLCLFIASLICQLLGIRSVFNRIA